MRGCCGDRLRLFPGAEGFASWSSQFATTPWKEQVLYSFCQSSNCLDGANPWGGLVLLPNGVLYGTTNIGGAFPDSGTVFSLTFDTMWHRAVVHNMGETTGDGVKPQASLLYAFGNLFGTVAGGGSSTNCNNFQGCGAV